MAGKAPRRNLGRGDTHVAGLPRWHPGRRTPRAPHIAWPPRYAGRVRWRPCPDNCGHGRNTVIHPSASPMKGTSTSSAARLSSSRAAVAGSSRLGLVRIPSLGSATPATPPRGMAKGEWRALYAEWQRASGARLRRVGGCPRRDACKRSTRGGWEGSAWRPRSPGRATRTRS